MSRKLTVALLFLTLLGLAGCNTVEGLGEDISATARTIKKQL
ncbi:entericidin [Parvibaculum lavamentivorans]|nr:entericidin [Parvibaculum lavamentivorans]